MKAVVSVSLIAFGFVAETVDPVNAENYNSGNFAPSIEGGARYSAKIIGSDGRARTPTQHAYWMARRPKNRNQESADAHVVPIR